MKTQIQKYISLFLIASFVFIMGTAKNAEAHFGMVIPSTDVVETEEDANINLKISFAHPFEGMGMEMERPEAFGVLFDGARTDLTETLNEIPLSLYADTTPHKAWKVEYLITRPGDYTFFVEPEPYFEPSEDCFIIHYTKVIVNAYAKEDGWSREIGLPTEIVPLSRPYGLYAGNVFRGQVMVDGKPAPYSEVEVEYFNEDGDYEAPKSVFVTQVVRSDENGIFTYACPKPGWWGFAALNEGPLTMQKDGVEKGVELGAVLWLRTYSME